jgi:transposase InsO family protein
MAAIIDWHSKAVLSHRISNTMDSQLVTSVLNDALEKHPHPEIFGLLGVVCPWFVIQATSINIQSLTLLINRQKRTRHVW